MDNENGKVYIDGSCQIDFLRMETYRVQVFYSADRMGRDFFAGIIEDDAATESIAFSGLFELWKALKHFNDRVKKSPSHG